MTGVFVLLGGITLFAAIVTLLDGISYRRDLRTKARRLRHPTK
jgi:hypothetical protein